MMTPLRLCHTLIACPAAWLGSPAPLQSSYHRALNTAVQFNRFYPPCLRMPDKILYVRVHDMRLHLSVLLLSCSVLLIACDGTANSPSGDTPQTAKGETPVRYIVCSAGDTDCFVVARFKDMNTCDDYREQNSMLCDRISTAGQITCRKDTSPRIGAGYCTL